MLVDVAVVSLEKEIFAKGEGQVPKLIKPDRPTFIHIKHPNHHLDCMRVKMRIVPIHQRIPQFPFAQLPCPALVHRLEERKQGRVGTAL